MARNLNSKQSTTNGYVHGGDEKNKQGGAREIPLVFGQDECVLPSSPSVASEGVATRRDAPAGQDSTADFAILSSLLSAVAARATELEGHTAFCE